MLLRLQCSEYPSDTEDKVNLAGSFALIGLVTAVAAKSIEALYSDQFHLFSINGLHQTAQQSPV